MTTAVNPYDTLRRPSSFSNLVEEPIWAYAIPSSSDPNSYTVVTVIVIDWNTIANRGEFWANVVAPGTSGIWIETSYSGAYRDYYAGIGYSYLPTSDSFLPAGAPPPEILSLFAFWQAHHCKLGIHLSRLRI